ncbi:MAG: hypothetical protein MJE66_02020 [Proteobacteria bacterium]|nr:hypothetical protein [Pseudomonadota bacterium]
MRAIVGVPLAALAGFCVVGLLRATYGDIEFTAPGFTFSGASGPVVLWVLCFLTSVVGIVSLWSRE